MPSMTKHLLTPGTWIGRGSFLEKGQSLGTTIECTFDVTSEQVGTHIKGELTLREGGTRHTFAVWITPNDTGTYDVAAQFAGNNLEGTAKMESYPNLGMLWGTTRRSAGVVRDVRSARRSRLPRIQPIAEVPAHVGNGVARGTRRRRPPTTSSRWVRVKNANDESTHNRCCASTATCIPATATRSSCC